MKPSRNNSSPTDRAGRIISAFIVAFSALALLCLGVAIGGRFFFEWPLEWMEGAMLQGAVRVLEGLPLYAPPRAVYVPFLYPPLSYLSMAASIALFGHAFWAARLPSVLALLGTLAFAAKTASEQSKSRFAAVLTVGLIALGYGYGEAFYDLARLDMVFLVLVVAGTERLQKGRAKTALALFVVSCLAKQHGLIFLFSASACLALRDLRRYLLSLAGAWLGVVAIYLSMHLLTGGWSTIYLLMVPRWHGVIPKLILAYFIYDVFMLLPLLAVISFAALWRHRFSPRAIDFMLMAALAASALGRAHPGGHDNVLIPGFVFMSIATSASLVPVLLSETRRAALRVLIAAGLFLQSLMLFQSPTLFWPPSGSPEKFSRAVAALNACAKNREAVSLDFAMLTETPFLHTMQLSDIRAGGDNWLGRMGTSALTERLSGEDAPFAIAVGASFTELDRVLKRYYQECATLEAPRMATGYEPQKMTIYKRRE
ncbi:MAG: hypothetical protein JXA30_14935 [Deltaproteobacteria bacterium]|nr:hypothetical protein [Deltaproteobacteria bacterium]